MWVDPVCLNGSKQAGVAVAAWVDGTGIGDEVGAVAGLIVWEMLGYGRSSDVDVSDTGGRWRLLSSGGAGSSLCCMVGLSWLLCCRRLLGDKSGDRSMPVFWVRDDGGLGPSSGGGSWGWLCMGLWVEVMGFAHGENEVN